jgi:hypothetical protein
MTRDWNDDDRILHELPQAEIEIEEASHGPSWNGAGEDLGRPSRTQKADRHPAISFLCGGGIAGSGSSICLLDFRSRLQGGPTLAFSSFMEIGCSSGSSSNFGS